MFDAPWPGLNLLLGTGVVIGSAVILIVWGVTSFFNDAGTLRSSQPITPRLEITVEGTTTDTIWVYQSLPKL